MGKHQDGGIEISRGGERLSEVGESHSGGRPDGRMWGGLHAVISNCDANGEDKRTTRRIIQRTTV